MEKLKESNLWAAVRRYGPDQCDFPTMLSNMSSLLRILTLNIDGRNTNRIPLVFVVLAIISFSIFVYVYYLSTFWFTFLRSGKMENLSAVFVEFSLNVTCEVSVIKLGCMMYNRKKLIQLTNKYLEYDSKIAPGSRYESNMLKNLRNVKIRGMFFWLTLNINGIVYILIPLVRPGRHLTTDGFVLYGLEPMLVSPNYEIATIVMAVAVLFICYTVAVVSTFLILITGYIEAQMLSLSEEIVNLWGDAIYHYQKMNNRNKRNIREHKILNEYIEKHLIDIIGKHSMIKSNLDEIEGIMRVPNAIGFVLLVMGVIAELLGGLSETYLQLPFTMLQLSVDCYLGQKVIDSNLMFEEAVYDCKWEKFNNSNRMIVLMMLQNSQKTMLLTAGGMATLSFVCLMSIIKTTYSAYTTLNSMV